MTEKILPKKRVSRGYLWLVLVVMALLVWSWFARPIYDSAIIIIRRVADRVREKTSPPATALPYDDLVDLNTRSAVEIDRYLSALRKSADSAPEMAGLSFAGKEKYEASKAALLAVLRRNLFFPPPGRISGEDFSTVRRTALGEDDLATYTLLEIPALPGVACKGVLILPKKHSGRLPLIIAAHGRGGMPEKPANGKIPIIQYNNRDLARGAIQRGWAVFEPIFVFYGAGQPENIRELLTIRAQEAGTTLPAIEFAKTIRAIDYLLSLPEIDSDKVAMAGISYGGFNTLYTTALDPRIKVAVVAAYFNDREKILDESEPDGFLDWRFSSSLGALRDPYLVALVCPRPLQIQSGDQDQLFPVEGSRSQIPLARSFYSRLGLEPQFDFHEFTGRHDFDGEAAWDFIAQHW